MIRDTIDTPSSGLKEVVFLAESGPNSFADGDAEYNGVCEVCHTSTNYHRNNSSGDHSHNAAVNCITCHPHSKDLAPQGGCIDCHNTPQGSRRQIVGTSGDFAKASHHVSGEVKDSDCTVCHDLSDHQAGVVKLKDPDDLNTVYDFIPSNPVVIENFCVNCHDSDGATAGNGVTPFSDNKIVPNINGVPGNLWANSAHNAVGYPQNSGNPISCYGDGSITGCHNNGHGSDNIKLLSAPSGQSLSDFCFNCHTDGMITNNAISGAGLADDIEQAFAVGSANKHNMGNNFSIASDSFILECTSCHNPHLVTGKYWEANQNKTPVTRPDFSDPLNNPRAMGTTLWGNETGEKMNDYGGTYRTPNGDLFSGSELPNYVRFCNDCHDPMPDPSIQSGAHGQLQFDNDPHGLNSANSPNGSGTPPDWYSVGKAEGWDGDNRVSADTNEWWPVIMRGRGDQLWSRPPYNHEERIEGANFALSCTDCHEAHGSDVSSAIRSNPNNGTGTGIWNTMCNNCHYYYSDWHAGMSCGNASCHVSDRMSLTGTNTLHRMSNNFGSGSTRTFDFNLVLDLKYENNLNDAGSWRMHSKWYDAAATGSYTTGKFGQAILLNGDHLVQVGTRNDYWSTDEGYHGTWKYTEMKFNTTLESWVYPTIDTYNEFSILSKHVGYGDGGYAFTLHKFDGTLRATFNAQIDNNGNAEGGINGVRGAYSSVAVPLNIWTHVAATFNTNGPDRDPVDPSVGRIRIFVNGEDVTTSSSNGNYMQPGANETSIYAYSENSPWNEAICYNGQWCASEFSVGGFTWQDGFIGKIDETKVWNITEDAAYFEPVDQQTAPFISRVEGITGNDKLWVTFSEEVYTNTGGSGNLQPSDFIFTDLDNLRSIINVNHTAGQKTAILTLSSTLDSVNDVGVDQLAAASNAIYDEYYNPAGTMPVTLMFSTVCPNSPISILINEAAGSSYVFDDQNILAGLVNDPVQTLLGDGLFTGDGLNNYIDFEYNNKCLQADRKMTIEFRIKPTGIGVDNYIRRILARDGGGNYQTSVWRNTDWINYNPPDNVASIALWVNPVDAHGGSAWKPVLTDYDNFPIVSDHWYQVKIVWDSDKAVGNIPCDIFVDDQGTNGLGSGENWIGFLNTTDSDQSQLTPELFLQLGDEIKTNDGSFSIGCNVSDHANNLFLGKIDWITWEDAVNYKSVGYGAK